MSAWAARNLGTNRHLTGGRTGAAMSTAFTPREIRACRLFFWADVGVAVSGGFLTTWTELVGAGATRNFTAAGAARPTFNASSATFGNRKSFTLDGTANFLTSAASTSFASGVTLLVAYKPDVVAAVTYTFFSALDLGGTSLLWQTNETFQAKDEAANDGGTKAATISIGPHVFVVSLVNGAQSYYLDALSTFATGAVTWGTFLVTQFGARNGIANFLDGEVRTIIAFDGVLSASDHARLSRWAANDSGVSVAA